MSREYESRGSALAEKSGYGFPATMTAAVYYAPGDVRVESMPVPVPGPGELLVAMEACGICGSDVMEWYTRAKAPAVLGHEPVGRVVARGIQIESPDPRPKVGDRVFVHHHVPCFTCRSCLAGHETLCQTFRQSRIVPGGFAEYFLVPAANAARDTLVLPSHVTAVAATLIEPLACVVRGHRRAQADPSGITAVIGLGQVGLLHVALARARGARRIVGIDPVSSRVTRANAFGATEGAASAEAFRALTGGEGATTMFIATGAPAAITTALEIAADGARIELFAPTKPGETLTIEPYDIFFRELSIVSSYSAGPHDTREALRLISEGLIDTENIVTHEFPLTETANALATQANEPGAIKVVVRGSTE